MASNWANTLESDRIGKGSSSSEEFR